MARHILSWNGIPIAYNSIPLQFEPPLLGFLNFYTGASTGFSGELRFNDGGIAQWDFADGSIENSNVVAHDFLIEGAKYVRVFDGSTSGALGTTYIDLINDNILGTLDLRSFSNLNHINIQGNPNIQHLLVANSSANMDFFSIQQCGLTGTLDVSGLTNMGGVFYGHLNSSLNHVIFPVSSRPFSQFSLAGDTNLLGPLDLSGLTGLGGYIDLYSMDNLHEILWPSSDELVNHIFLQGTSIEGTLDLTGFSRLGGTLFLTCNGGLTQVINPASSELIDGYYIFGNKLEYLDVSSFSRLGGLFWASQCPSLKTITHGDSSEIFNTYKVYGCDLTGVLDLSPLSQLGGEIQLYANPNLTQVINPPASTTPVSNYLANDCNLTGTLDVSGLLNLGGTILLNQNPNLNYILNPPNSSTEVNTYWASECDLLDTLDLRGLKLGGDIRLGNNPNLNYVLNPASSNNISIYLIGNCDLMGTLDVSGFTALSNVFQVNGNPNLTEILNPISSGVFIQYIVSGNNLKTLDLSGLSNIGGLIQLTYNYELKELILPTLNQPVTSINALDCSLDLTSIDNIFSKLNAWYTATPPAEDIIVDVHGGGNSWPTDGSSNTNILNLLSIFNGVGRDASITINYPPLASFGFITFQTSAYGPNNFNPIMVTDAGVLNWDLGDSSTSVDLNTFNHDYTVSGNKTVNIFSGTTSGPNSILEFSLNSCLVEGILDISTLVNMTDFNIGGCTGVTQIIHPDSSALLFYYAAQNCGLTNTLDLRSLHNLGATLVLQYNPDLTNVLFPDSSQSWNEIYLDNCNLSGTLDVSCLTGLGGYFNINTNPNLTKILFPVSAQDFPNIYIYDCKLTGVLDVSGLTGLRNDFRAYGNPITEILFPDVAAAFNWFDAKDCSLTGVIDVSKFTVAGYFDVHNNYQLTDILHGPSNQGIFWYAAFNCDLTGTLDLHELTGLGGVIQIQNNPNLTEIKFPTSPTQVTTFAVNTCNLSVLDVSGFSDMSGWVTFTNNPNLTTIICPSSNGDFSSGGFIGEDCSLKILDVSSLFNFGGYVTLRNNEVLQEFILPDTLTRQFSQLILKNCSLNLTSIDSMFSKLHALYDASAPYQNITVDAGGGGNSWPTDGWANTDLVALQNIFTLAGFDASITINDAPELPLMTLITEASTNSAFNAIFTVTI